MKITDRMTNKVKTILRSKLSGSFMKDKQCALLTNNCLGGFLYHDWGMNFVTPIINLQMDNGTFIRFCEALPESLNWEIKELNIEDRKFYSRFDREDNPFPVGEFEGGLIYFQHYHSFSEAVDSWKRRSLRFKEWLESGKEINVVMTCSQYTNEEKNAFMNLPFSKKLILVENGIEKGEGVWSLRIRRGKAWFDFCSGFSTRRYYDQFDFAHWVTLYKNK